MYFYEKEMMLPIDADHDIIHQHDFPESEIHDEVQMNLDEKREFAMKKVQREKEARAAQLSQWTAKVINNIHYLEAKIHTQDMKTIDLDVFIEEVSHQYELLLMIRRIINGDVEIKGLGYDNSLKSSELESEFGRKLL